jgi:hypothetical protein
MSRSSSDSHARLGIADTARGGVILGPERVDNRFGSGHRDAEAIENGMPEDKRAFGGKRDDVGRAHLLQFVPLSQIFAPRS